MRVLQRLWPALEEIGGLAAIPAIWREHLVDEADVIAGFLRPTDRRATRFPCPSLGGDGCPRQISERHNGTFVATCGDRPQRCDPIELCQAERVIHELDVGRLSDSLAILLGLAGAFQNVTACPQTWQLGSYAPLSGQAFPAYLTIQDSSDQLYAVAVRLCGIAAGPFLLFVPTRRPIDPVTTELAARSRSRLIALEEVVAADESGRWVTQRPPAEVLREFRIGVLGEQLKATEVVRFPTPPGVRWEDVSMHFINGQEIYVQIKGESAICEFTHLGMVDRRKKDPPQPDVQWQLLLAFAENGGEITWHSSQASPKNQKRKELLAKRLRGFFRIGDDPFEPLPKGMGWRARFHLTLS